MPTPKPGSETAPKSTATPKPPPTPIEIARQLLLKKDDTGALPVLREFLQSNSKHADALEAQYLLGLIQGRNKQLVEALSTFESLTIRHRGTEWAAQAYEQCILLQEQRRSLHEAQRAREDLLRYNPNSPVTLRIWSAIADELYQAQKFAEAVEIYAKFEKKLPPATLMRLKTARALSTAKGDPTILLTAANDALKEKNVALAMQLYGSIDANKATPLQLAEAQTKLGWCHYVNDDKDEKDDKGHLKKAESLWLGVAGKSPKSEWGGESRWHLVQLEAGPKADWKKAAELCASIARDFPAGTFRHEQALFTRAWLFWVQKQWTEGKAAFDALISAYPAKATHPPIISYIKDCETGLTEKKTK